MQDAYVILSAHGDVYRDVYIHQMQMCIYRCRCVYTLLSRQVLWSDRTPLHGMLYQVQLSSCNSACAFSGIDLACQYLMSAHWTPRVSPRGLENLYMLCTTSGLIISVMNTVYTILIHKCCGYVHRCHFSRCSFIASFWCYLRWKHIRGSFSLVKINGASTKHLTSQQCSFVDGRCEKS